MGWIGRAARMLLMVVVALSGAGSTMTMASDLGPPAGQHAGKVIAWDERAERLVLVEEEKGKRPRRVTLWTDPQIMVTAAGCGSQDLFGHEKSCRGQTLANLKAGDRVQVEWRRAGRRHVAVTVRRLP